MGAELGLAVLGEDLQTWGEGRSVGAGGSRYAHVCASMNVWTPCSLITPPSYLHQCRPRCGPHNELVVVECVDFKKGVIRACTHVHLGGRRHVRCDK